MIKPSLSARSALLSMLLLVVPWTLPAQQPPAADSGDIKLDEIIKETQLSIGGRDTAGLVWWLPTEFWVQSAIEQGSTTEQANAIGKERVQANWKFCPWHGNRLDDGVSAPRSVEQRKKEEKPQ